MHAAVRHLTAVVMVMLFGPAFPSGPSLASAQPITTIANPGWRVGGTPNGIARIGDVLYIGGVFRGIAPAGNGSGNMLLVDGVSGALRSGLAQFVGSVAAIEADGAGGWYVGGNYLDVVDGTVQPRFRLAHVLPGGALDPVWRPTAEGGLVRALKRVPGVGVFVGGDFTALSGVPRARVGLLDAASGAVLPWSYEIAGSGAHVRTLAHDGDTLVIGGAFATVNGLSRANLATVSSSSSGLVGPDFALNGAVDALAVAAPGTLFVGGNFSSGLGQARARLLRVSHPGGQLSLVLDAWNPGADNVVRAIAVDGSRVFVGGDFRTVAGVLRYGLAQLDAATGAAAPFAPIVFGNVNTLAVGGSTLYVGGPFSAVGDYARSGAVAFSTATGGVLPWNPGPAGPVQVIATSGADVGIAGQIVGHGAAPASVLAALDLQTGAVRPWDPEPYGGSVDELLALGSTVFIAGSFQGFSALDPAAGLAAIDAVTGEPRQWTPNPNGPLTGLAADGTHLYVAGSFTTIAGQPRNGVARFSLSSLALDPTFSPSIGPAGGTIQDIVLGGGVLYVGGGLISLNGGTPTRVLAIDTVTGAALPGFASSPNAPINRMNYHDGALYLAGSFQQVDGQPRSLVAKLDGATGALQSWTAGQFALDAAGIAAGFQLAANDIDATDQSVLVSGAFSTAAGVQRLGLAQFDTTAGGLTAWAPELGSGPSGGFGGPVLRDADLTVVGGARLQLADELLNGLALFLEPSAQLPVPPVALTADLIGGNVTIRWTRAPIGMQAASYVVEAGTRAGLADIARLNTGDATSFSVAGVPAGTYYLRVRAVTALGVGAATPDIAIRVGVSTCVAPPEPPVSLMAYDIGGGRVSIVWRGAAGSPSTSFLVEAGVSPGLWNIGPLDVTTAPHIVSGVPRGVYYLRARSRNDCGVSQPGPEVVIATGGAALPPTAPAGIAATVSNSTVTLRWLPSASAAATGYRLEVGSSYGATDAAVVTTSAPSISAANVPRGVYYVRVRTLGAGGVGAPSAEFVLVVP